jgi:hypothetical protein
MSRRSQRMIRHGYLLADLAVAGVMLGALAALLAGHGSAYSHVMRYRDECPSVIDLARVAPRSGYSPAMQTWTDEVMQADLAAAAFGDPLDRRIAADLDVGRVWDAVKFRDASPRQAIGPALADCTHAEQRRKR